MEILLKIKLLVEGKQRKMIEEPKLMISCEASWAQINMGLGCIYICIKEPELARAINFD